MDESNRKKDWENVIVFDGILIGKNAIGDEYVFCLYYPIYVSTLI